MPDASSENKKYGEDYKDYIEVCSGLPHKDNAAHWLVFGDMNSSDQLELKYRHYHGTRDKVNH